MSGLLRHKQSQDMQAHQGQALRRADGGHQVVAVTSYVLVRQSARRASRQVCYGIRVTRTTLDPKVDVVFKLLFAKPSNKRLLIALLTAILQPDSPIVDVEVLNPEVTKESVEAKGTVLDLLAKLFGGGQVNLEIQASPQGWRMSRGVFYCSRVFVSQLSRGDGYEELKPVVGIFILDFRALPSERFHSKFELLEVQEHTRLSDDLTIHVLELPKLRPMPLPPALVEW